MRHAVAVLFAVCCFAGFSSSVSTAQTADELIAKNILARGGMEKMKAIKTIRMSGKFEGGGGFVASVGQENQRPNLLRETFSLQGMTVVQAYDGSAGWQIQPFGGKKDPELMGEDDLRELLLDADFDGPLVDYKEKGSTVEYMGHDVVDGDDALRLKITQKMATSSMTISIRILSSRFAGRSSMFIRGSVKEKVIGLGSYKPVDGVMFPFSITQGTKNNPDDQTVTVRKLEVNVPIDPADFALPASLKAEPRRNPGWSGFTKQTPVPGI